MIYTVSVINLYCVIFQQQSTQSCYISITQSRDISVTQSRDISVKSKLFLKLLAINEREIRSMCL